MSEAVELDHYYNGQDQSHSLGGDDDYRFDHPSAPALASQTPDTLGASAFDPPSRTAVVTHQQSPLPDLAHQGPGRPSQAYRPDSSGPAPAQPPLHSPRSTRSHSLAASLASLGSQSPIRRKPLSPTASPLAVRFSSKLSHMPLHDLQQPDSGYFSLDSPDLYELAPNTQDTQDPGPGPVPVSVSTLLPIPLEEEQYEEEYVTSLVVSFV